jgi:phospholipase C
MTYASRREFLRMAGAAGVLLPGLIERALAIPSGSGTGSIRDVRHVVVLMQENRSFDHYFGVLSGVRGFGDPRPLRLPGGKSVWAQSSEEHPDGFVLPFLGDSRSTRSYLVGGAEQCHEENLHIFNRGRCDRWGRTGELHKRMLHYSADDLPFYYALADAFTICDAYHCSTMTQTQPNRLHLFSGCNGGGGCGGEPDMTNYGEDETPSADMSEDRGLRPDAFRWGTYAERLQAAGVSWKVYQEYDNFGDNSMSFFPAFRNCTPDSELYRRGRAWVSESKSGADRTRSDGEQLVAAFRHDIETGQLPQVSWIVAAEALSEHPNAVPARGEHLTARLLEALVDHPEVFAGTVFILNYDEAGGFFDHAPPAVPPVGAYRGRSTVQLDGESTEYRGDGAATAGQHPIGLGVRTPAIIVSPWTRGGYVCSELFDHTSVLRFMERCFGVAEPNISAWRRSVCGDLTSAFDFSSANPSRVPEVPPTSDFLARIARSEAGRAHTIPELQLLTAQMPGQRPHRALPYDFDAVATVTPEGRLRIEVINRGGTGVALTVHDNTDRLEPWHYTIGAGDRLASEQWHDDGLRSDYDFTLRGPNGFWRRLAGSLASPLAGVGAWLVARRATGDVEIVLRNDRAERARFVITLDEHYSATRLRTREVSVDGRSDVRVAWPLEASDQWYDLAVTVSGAPEFLRRFAGKVETGRPGLTDPGIGPMRLET